MIKSRKAIAAIFRQVADKIENGTCEVDDSELTELANVCIHRKLNAEQVCRHLNVSRSTLTRMVADGRVPHPKKTLGGDKYWWQDEVDESMLAYNQKYGL